MDRCFIIAEAGVNHNGSIELAKKLVDAAAEAGISAIVQPGGSMRDEEVIQAANEHGLLPRTISFKGTMQTLRAFHPFIAIQGNTGQQKLAVSEKPGQQAQKSFFRPWRCQNK